MSPSPHYEAPHYENRHGIDLATLSNGETVEIATRDHLFYFERQGDNLVARDHNGTIIAEEPISSLKNNKSSLVESDGKLLLPSLHIDKAEQVVLIRMTAGQIFRRQNLTK